MGPVPPFLSYEPSIGLSGGSPMPGLLDKKRGKTTPSFLKQKMELRSNLLPPFLSNEPGSNCLAVVLTEDCDLAVGC
jgi:hypothetical protein